VSRIILAIGLLLIVASVAPPFSAVVPASRDRIIVEPTRASGDKIIVEPTAAACGAFDRGRLGAFRSHVVGSGSSAH
jgi:hypothetical protein